MHSEDKIDKIEYFLIDSLNEFKFLDNMHRVIIQDNFQKTLHGSDETNYRNVFNNFLIK